ncbi:MAG: DUF4402 domain-containing protein [Pseudomonadota bacterium]
MSTTTDLAGRRALSAAALVLGAGAASGGWAQSLQALSPLDFGTFAAGGAGSVTIGADGARSAAGAVQLIAKSPGAPATFSVSNDSDSPLHCAPATLSAQSGLLQAQDIKAFTSSRIATLGPRQTLILTVGATLTVTAGAASAPSSHYAAPRAVSLHIHCTP